MMNVIKHFAFFALGALIAGVLLTNCYVPPCETDTECEERHGV